MEQRNGGYSRLPEIEEGNQIVQEIRSFKTFIKQGNFFELATALVVGKAFSEVVSSFVNDIFAPLTSLILLTNLTEVFWVLKSGPHAPYQTREQAVADGAITLNYGNFIEIVIDFVVVSLCFYLVLKVYNRLHDDTIEGGEGDLNQPR